MATLVGLNNHLFDEDTLSIGKQKLVEAGLGPLLASESRVSVGSATSLTDLQARLAEANLGPAPTFAPQVEIPQFGNLNLEDLVGNRARRVARSGEVEEIADLDLPSPFDFGIGRPISIRFEILYTGDLDPNWFGKTSKHLMIVSGVRLENQPPAPRAINLITDTAKPHSFIGPNAFSKGSPTVYYSPSLLSGVTLVTFEVVGDTFNDEVLSTISGLLQYAGGVPAFAPASAALFTGAQILNLANTIGQGFLQRPPFISDTEIIRFNQKKKEDNWVGNSITSFMDSDANEFKGYELKNLDDGRNHKALVNSRGKAYDGDAPYLIATMDDTVNEQLANFEPTLASAELLEQFYGKDKSDQAAEALKEAMDLQNDRIHYDAALKLKEKYLDNATPDDMKTEPYKTQKQLYEAYKSNIRNKDFFSLP